MCIEWKKASSLTKSQLVTKVAQYAYNVAYEEFLSDLEDILDMKNIQHSYADEMFQRMRGDFGLFYCNLDDEAKERFVGKALEHYGYAD